MGHKTIKEKYNILHTVQIRYEDKYGGDCILIGSGYIPDLIAIRISDGKVVKKYTDREYQNKDLFRYNKEILRDEENGTLKKLIDAKDEFVNHIPVFTTSKGYIVKHYCEEFAYPNVTHSGELMYNNTFFKTRKEAYRHLIKETSLERRWLQSGRTIKESFVKICKAIKYDLEQILYCIRARTISIIRIKIIN